MYVCENALTLATRRRNATVLSLWLSLGIRNVERDIFGDGSTDLVEFGTPVVLPVEHWIEVKASGVHYRDEAELHERHSA